MDHSLGVMDIKKASRYRDIRFASGICWVHRLGNAVIARRSFGKTNCCVRIDCYADPAIERAVQADWHGLGELGTNTSVMAVECA